MADERKASGKRDHAQVSGGAGGGDEPPRDKPPSLSKVAEHVVRKLREKKPTKEDARCQHILLERTPGTTPATVDIDSVFAGEGSEGQLPRRSLEIRPFMEGTLSASSSTTTTTTTGRVVQSTATGSAALTSSSTTTTTTTTGRSSARGTAALTSSTSPAQPKPDQQSGGAKDDEENTKG